MRGRMQRIGNLTYSEKNDGWGWGRAYSFSCKWFLIIIFKKTDRRDSQQTFQLEFPFLPRVHFYDRLNNVYLAVTLGTT